jgi:hypothetical protein
MLILKSREPSAVKPYTTTTTTTIPSTTHTIPAKWPMTGNLSKDFVLQVSQVQ